MNRECIDCGKGIVPGTDQRVEHCWNCVNEAEERSPKWLREQIDKLLFEVQVHNELGKRYAEAGNTRKADTQNALARQKLDDVDKLDIERAKLLAGDGNTVRIAAE